MTVLVFRALCILQTERNSGRDPEDASVRRLASFLLLIINVKVVVGGGGKMRRCPTGTQLQSFRFPHQAAKMHTYIPSRMNNRSRHQSGDSLCSCRCPRPENGAPENSPLLASAQPRLRSICSQRCPNSGEPRARLHECFIRRRYMQQAAAIFTSVCCIYPPAYGGGGLAAGAGDTLKRATSRRLQLMAVCSKVF